MGDSSVQENGMHCVKRDVRIPFYSDWRNARMKSHIAKRQSCIAVACCCIALVLAVVLGATSGSKDNGQAHDSALIGQDSARKSANEEAIPLARFRTTIMMPTNKPSLMWCIAIQTMSWLRSRPTRRVSLPSMGTQNPQVVYYQLIR